MWQRGLRGNSATCSALCWFSVTSPATYNQIGPFWCSFLGRWVCVHSRTLWVSPMNSPGGWEFLPLPSQPPQVFSVIGFEALFPCTESLGCVVCLAPQLFLLVYLHGNVGLPSLQAASLPGPPVTALPWVLSTQVPVSAPPTGLDECLFFNSLVVRLPHSLIFFQFWLFLNLSCPSFGSVRRHSVSTYTSILARSPSL